MVCGAEARITLPTQLVLRAMLRRRYYHLISNESAVLVRAWEWRRALVGAGCATDDDATRRAER